jgi:hypothetical protein
MRLRIFIGRPKRRSIKIIRSCKKGDTYRHDNNQASRDVGVEHVVTQSTLQHENHFQTSKVSFKKKKKKKKIK